MSTPLLIKDLYMFQETTNSSFEVGADLVKKTDVDLWVRNYSVDPDGKVDWDAIRSIFESWETDGYIKILADIRTCKAKDYCFQILRKITAIPTPPDLLED